MEMECLQAEGVAYRGAAFVEIKTELTEGTPSIPVMQIDREDIIRSEVFSCLFVCFSLSPCFL